MKLLRFHGKNGYSNALRCYVIHNWLPCYKLRTSKFRRYVFHKLEILVLTNRSKRRLKMKRFIQSAFQYPSLLKNVFFVAYTYIAAALCLYCNSGKFGILVSSSSVHLKLLRLVFFLSWISHILLRNCFLKYVIWKQIEGKIEVTWRPEEDVSCC